MAKVLTEQVIAPTTTSPMPMLTLRGFIDATAKYTLVDPSKGWTHLNTALRAYQLPIWRACGDLPRSALPGAPNSGVQAQLAVDAAQQRAQLAQSTEDQLAAMELSASINARGNQIMLGNSVPGYTYKREYYRF
jgi:hypothetical protein